jgi:hypothetical protein
MTYILTCGCESQYGGFPSEWDGETRECEPAVFYGCLCDKHFGEYDARPAQLEPRELSDEEIWQVGRTLGYEFTNKNPDNVFLQFARAVLKKASEK